MRKTFTLLIALMALCVYSWATPTTITWDSENGLTSIDVYSNSGSPATSSQSLEGVTLTGATFVTDDYAGFYTYESNTRISVSNGGTLTFSSLLYEIQSIVINFGGSGYAAGWITDGNTLTWTGSATHSVEMTNAYVTNITSIVFTVEAVPTTTVTWDTEEVATISLSCSDIDEVQTASEIDGITASLTKISAGDPCQFSGSEIWFNDACGKVTFTSSVGNIMSIVITCGTVWNHYDLSDGWTFNGEANTLTWEGTASNEVILSGGIDFMVSSIEFIIDASAPAPVVTTTTVTWDTEEVATISLECSSVDEVQAASEIDGITASLTRTNMSSEYCKFTSNEIWVYESGEVTFTSSVGNISGILITCDPLNDVWSHYNLSEGWTFDGEAKTFTWTGTPSNSVTLSGYIDFLVSSIEFTVETAAAPADPVDQDPVTWDFANDEELASLDLLQYTHYNFHGYYSEYYDNRYSETVKDFKGIVATISAMIDDSYASFSTSSGISLENGGTLTFSTELGQFQSIVVNTNGGYGSSSGDWAWDLVEKTLTWAGTPANSVVLDNVDISDITSIVFTFVSSASADPEPEPIPGPSFIWEQRQINHVDLIADETAPVIKNIIASVTRTSNGGNCYFGYWGQKGKLNIGNCGYLTFQSLVGDLRAIVITCSSVTTAEDLSTDWTYDGEAGTLTWVGEYASDEVTISGNINIDISKIEFYYTLASAPRLGETFYDAAYQLYEITGAQTAKVAQQQWLSHTLDIPASVEDGGVTYYITEIDDYAFQDDLDLPNVMGGANIGRIGEGAFDGCLRMDEIDIESEVLDTIGAAAFRSCKLMQDIGFYTEQPPVLGDNAFEDTRYLNHILVPSDSLAAYRSAWFDYSAKINTTYSNPQVGEQFFFHNQNTTNIYAVLGTSPKEAKVLPYTAEVNAIYPITREGTLVIPEEADYIHNSYTITGIGANAYKDSTRFTTVMMPEAVKLIEEGAFRNCTGVEKVYFLWDDPTEVTWADADQGLDFATATSGNTKIFVPENRLDEYKAWAPAWASCMIGADILDVTASQDPKNNIRYYRTFYDSEVDYMMPPSVWAHAGYISGDNFILHAVAYDGEIVPRGTAVVLESETPTYRLIPTGNDAPLYTGRNDLIGTDVDLAVSSLAPNDDKVYVLGQQANIGGDLRVGMGMYRYTGSTLGAHKAYMILNSGSSAPARFLFRPEKDAPTGIENVSDNELCTKILRDGQLVIIKDGKEYNAQGQIIK